MFKCHHQIDRWNESNAESTEQANLPTEMLLKMFHKKTDKQKATKWSSTKSKI